MSERYSRNEFYIGPADYRTCGCGRICPAYVMVDGMCEFCQEEKKIGRFAVGIKIIGDIADNLQVEIGKRNIFVRQFGDSIMYNLTTNKLFDNLSKNGYEAVKQAQEVQIMSKILKALDDLRTNTIDKVQSLAAIQYHANLIKCDIKDAPSTSGGFFEPVQNAQIEALDNVIKLIQEIKDQLNIELAKGGDKFLQAAYEIEPEAKNESTQDAR